MKIIAENDMKRGDAVIHNKPYVVEYIYLDRKAKEIKRAKLKAFTVLHGKELEVKDWFHDTYPLYEAIRVHEAKGE